MEVQDLLKSDSNSVVSVRTDMTIAEVARVMAQEKIGFVVVLDGSGKLAGVMSERDILMSLTTEAADRSEAPVSDIMTRNVVTCSRGDNVLQAVELMGSNSIRHLVVTENGEVAGVLSSRDLFEVMAIRIEERGLLADETHDSEPDQDNVNQTARRA